MGKLLGAVIVATTGLALLAPPAAAEPLPTPPGCERFLILGLHPRVRKICDTPARPDGSWERLRQFTAQMSVRSSCGEYGYDCPPWAPKDVIPAWESPVESYIVTWDTIPPGEPGHLCPTGC